jgi:glycosyltransferase involved in cell wall biosynthesis
MTAREAMAYGRPVVATRVGGLTELEGDGVVLVAPRDSAALRLAIGGLLSDPTAVGAVGQAARKRAMGEFATNAATDRLFEVYELVVEQQR